MGTLFAVTTGCYAAIRFDECPCIKFRTIYFLHLLACVDHNPPMTLLSIDYFQRSKAVAKFGAESIYGQLLHLREAFVSPDDTGLDRFTPTTQQTACQCTYSDASGRE